MIAALTFAFLLQTPQQSDLPPAKELIGAMFQRYFTAKSVRGHIKYTVTAGTVSGALDTDIQLERPGKLFIHQVQSGAVSKEWLVTADGTQVSYGAPKNTPVPLGARLIEKIGPNAALKDLKDAYTAASLSIEDRSVPLDIAVARTVDLDHFRYQLKTVTTQAQIDYSGKPAYVVSGDWKEYGNGPVLGKYQIVMSRDGELYRYVISRFVAVPGGNIPPQRIVQTWDVALAIDGPIDQTLFTVVK